MLTAIPAQLDRYRANSLALYIDSRYTSYRDKERRGQGDPGYIRRG